MVEPIAIYRESRFERRCRFDLFADAIRARGKTFTTDFDTTIPLSRLHPEMVRLRVYGVLLYSGFWIFMFGLIGLLVIGYLVIGSDPRVPNSVSKPIGAIALTGLLTMVLGLRKIEIVTFVSDAGVPTLSIARTRRRGVEFEQFLTLLVEQIRRVRAEATPGASSSVEPESR